MSSYRISMPSHYVVSSDNHIMYQLVMPSYQHVAISYQHMITPCHIIISPLSKGKHIFFNNIFVERICCSRASRTCAKQYPPPCPRHQWSVSNAVASLWMSGRVPLRAGQDPLSLFPGAPGSGRELLRDFLVHFWASFF